MPASMLPTYPESTMRELARNILRHTLRMKRGENLLVETWSATLPWAESLVLEARVLGVRPMLLVEDEETFWKSAAEAPAANVGQVGSHDWAALKASDAFMYFFGPSDSAREEALPKSVLGRIEANDHEWFRLVEKGGIRSARWDLGRTSEISARRYGVDLANWRSELVEGAILDPRSLQKDGARLGELLRRGKEVKITHPNGTDLTLRLAGRRPKVDDGVVDDADLRAGNIMAVLPSGVAAVAVAETYAEGTFVGNVMGVMFARAVETPLRGGSWTFRRGRLSEFTFDQGEDAFRREFARFGAGKDRPGSLSVGLNPRISSIPLLFDQARGVVTVGIGRNSWVGGSTRTPHFTAYQSLRGGTLEVDGTTVIDGGTLVE
jgi:leucyl aminopeptidase (aminopeptidase T)